MSEVLVRSGWGEKGLGGWRLDGWMEDVLSGGFRGCWFVRSVVLIVKFVCLRELCF